MKRRLSFGLALCFGTALGCGDDTGSGPVTPDGGADAGESSSGSTSATSSGGATTSSTGGGSSSGSTSSTVPDSGGPGDEGDAGDGGVDVEWGDGGSLSISSPNFDDGAPLPEEYTCEGSTFGSGISPQLEWSGAAPGTKRYALAFVDVSLLGTPQEMRGYHWVAYDIPVTVSGIPEELGGEVNPPELEGGTQVRGGPPQDDQNFFGPCPSWFITVCPDGTERANDNYQFILYTFDSDDLDYPEATDTRPEGQSYPQALTLFFEANATEKTFVSATSNASSTNVPLTPNGPAMCPFVTPSDAGVDGGDAGSDGGAVEGDSSTGDAGDAEAPAEGDAAIDAAAGDAADGAP